MSPDLPTAEAFLRVLDPTTDEFLYQTADDWKERPRGKNGKLAAIRYGTLKEHTAELCALSARGAAVWVMVNAGGSHPPPGKNAVRNADIVTRIRYHWADFDEEPATNCSRLGIKPDIIVQSSPGKYQLYWRVSDVPIKDFEPRQERLNALLGADPQLKDLPRVLRLPGFPHQKKPAAPFMVRMIWPQVTP
ncbi:MAG TPA: DNA-primase RepB domain-containing protein [Bradyrhizobium sp.]|nr:DNA-primase RepB domain-containing protein [Bradyrhizobium sp.]